MVYRTYVLRGVGALGDQARSPKSGFSPAGCSSTPHRLPFSLPPNKRGRTNLRRRFHCRAPLPLVLPISKLLLGIVALWLESRKVCHGEAADCRPRHLMPECEPSHTMFTSPALERNPVRDMAVTWKWSLTNPDVQESKSPSNRLHAVMSALQ